MILIFLGSWRSTIVVLISIPLSILTSIAVLAALGQTLNTMTLGGLALAVGILVDDSTVTIENTHRLLDERMAFDEAVLEGSATIAVPTLISTLAICCVFVSVFFLQGAARFLFTPMALAVVFAMLASYGLSRTLTPIVIRLMERSQHQLHAAEKTLGWFARLHAGFNRGFDRFRNAYLLLLTGILRRRLITPLVAVALVCGAGLLSLRVGTDFFPPVDAGLIQLHVRAPARTRIEETSKIFAAVEDRIRSIIPAKDLSLVLDNIGLPERAYNDAFTDGTIIGVNDGEILLQLKEGHRPTVEYIRALRRALPTAFPEALFYFQPADQVTQVLNFGIPSQIDVRVMGPDRAGNTKTAAELSRRFATIPGMVDVRVQQELDAPQLYYTVDRTRAQELGLTVSQVTNDINISTSSSEQVTPNFWTDPTNGIPYYLTVQTPEYKIRNVTDLNNTPITSTSGTVSPVPGLFGNVATFKRVAVQSVYNQSNIQPVYDVYGSVQDRDVGSVSSQITKIVDSLQPGMPAGNQIVVTGQIASMKGAFANLTLGLLFAAVFVYMLMVVNYQSFVDPLAVVLALPGAGCGIIAMLYVTGTTFSVPSLMGAIMSVGVASANSILLVTFAREQRATGMSATEAALSAGATRLRPVLMTAAAMMVGMVPMAIGGPGEEQNAVLARAVIGGMLVGTVATLLFVPYLYSVFGTFDRNAFPGSDEPSRQGEPA